MAITKTDNIMRILKPCSVVGGVILFALGLSTGAQAYDFEVNNVYYTILSEDEKTVEVACGNTTEVYPDCPPPEGGWGDPAEYWAGGSYEGDVTIPPTVTYRGEEYKVVAIGKGAFVRCADLTSVELPPTIEEMGDFSFYMCQRIRQFRMPEKVRLIPEGCLVSAASYLDGDFVITDYGHITGIGDEAFLSSRIRTFDFADTGISGVSDVGERIFKDSNIGEIVLPSDWDDAGYAGLINKIATPLPENLSLLKLDRDVPPVVDPAGVTVDAALYTQVALSVPAESVGAYSRSGFWKNFRNIVAAGVEGVGCGGVSGSVRYYDLRGIRIDGMPEKGTFVICVKDGRAAKVIAR